MGTENELVVYKRIQITLGLIDSCLIVSGLADVTIGACIAYDLDKEDKSNTVSFIWLLGLPLIVSGAVGLFTVYKSSKAWTLVWVVVAVTTNSAVFIYISVSHQLDPDVFGINLNVFGKCQEQNNTLCLCKLPRQTAFGVLYTSCENVRWRTVWFLVIISVLALALATLIIALFLALTSAFWLPRCLNKKEEDLKMYSTYTSFYMAETTCANELAPPPNSVTKINRQPLLADVDASHEEIEIK